ncbi:MAG: hypothetical protein SYR96_07860 [Actinomycetota bacterium]|nr:hypothetical protein [Actinomycetota bacterium]
MVIGRVGRGQRFAAGAFGLPEILNRAGAGADRVVANEEQPHSPEAEGQIMTIGPTHWMSHISLVHLHTDVQRLRTDFVSGADQRIIAADRAAVQDSRRVINTHRSALIDVTV